MGEQPFSTAALKRWNQLSDHVRNIELKINLLGKHAVKPFNLTVTNQK